MSHCVPTLIMTMAIHVTDMDWRDVIWTHVCANMLTMRLAHRYVMIDVHVEKLSRNTAAHLMSSCLSHFVSFVSRAAHVMAAIMLAAVNAHDPVPLAFIESLILSATKNEIENRIRSVSAFVGWAITTVA